MKKLLIVGAYGTGNIGDEALLSGLLNLLQKTNQSKNQKKMDVVVFSRTPQETTKLHHMQAKRKNLFDFITASELILGGGELFQDRGFMALKYSFLIIAAKILRKKVSLIGIGVSEIVNSVGRFLTKISFKIADNISVRNEKSKKNLFNLGVNRKILVEPDLSFHLAAISKKEAYSILEREKIMLHPKDFVIGIVLQYIPHSCWKQQDSFEIAQSFVGVINKMLKNLNCQVIFIPFNKHKDKNYDDDVIYGKKIKKLIRNGRFNIISKLYKPQEVKGIIKLFDLIVSTRLHPLIFANSVGVHCIGIDVFEKVKSYCRENNIPTVGLDEIDKINILSERIYERKIKTQPINLDQTFQNKQTNSTTD